MSRPIEACVILLPIFEFVLRNRTFPSILVEGVKDAAGDQTSRPPLAHTIVSLSSYLLTHATSTSSRAIAYANIALNILLALVETKEIIRVFCELGPHPVRLCRQVCPTVVSITFALKIFLKEAPNAPVCTVSSPAHLCCSRLLCSLASTQPAQTT
jgi:hypothetical protein